MNNLKKDDKLKLMARKFIYSCLYLQAYLQGLLVAKINPNIFILCYHSVAKDQWKYSVDFEILKKQVEYLSKRYQPITLEDIELHIQGQKNLLMPSFALCFDDGYKNIYQTKDFFKKLRIQPALFVLSDREKANTEELETNRDFLTKKEVLELKKSGWIIGSHSATHPDFYSLTDEQIETEVIKSKEDLEKELGIKVKYFAYPKGRYTDKVLRAVEKAGYSLGLSMNDGFIDRQINRFLIPRIGVDGTHSFSEFKSIFMPSSIKFRRLIKARMRILV